MPHLIVEYSSDLEGEIKTSVLLNDILQASIESALFSPEDIKLRSISYRDFLVGGEAKSFVHVTAKILSGRNLEQRKLLSETILKKLDCMFNRPVSLTVEVVEIERASYSKLVK